MISHLHSRQLLLILATVIFGLAIACGTDAASPDAAGAGHEDDHAADEATALAGHEDDDHAVAHDDDQAAEASEAEEHMHGMGTVDPDAPVVHVFATEFKYEAANFEAEAEHPFTIMLHNEGVLEHDIVIEGFEDQGGIHLLSQEDGMATFEVHEPGEYKVYCTVPGHREAGMESTLVIEGDEHGA